MRPDPDKVLWVAVFDGGKALIFQNDGFDDAVNLRLLARYDNDNPPDREQTTDAPGRFEDSGGGAKGMPADVAAGRSSVEQTDRHELEKLRFTDRLMDRLAQDAEAHLFDRLILVAADRVLGEARERYTDRLERRIIHEEPKDVTNEPSDKLEARVQTLLVDLPSPTPHSHAEVSGPDGR